MNLHTKEKLIKPRFETIRKYHLINCEPLNSNIDKDSQIQELFTEDNQDKIAEILVSELNKIVKKLLVKHKVQKKNYETKF